MKTGTKWAIGILGAGAAVGGVWALSRRTSTTIGEYRPGAMPMPRATRTTRRDGRSVTLYDGVKTLNQRLAVIQKGVFDGVNDPRMRKLALDITRHCPERDGMCEARAVFDAVKSRIRYTGDIAPIKHPDGSVEGIDYYQTADATWNYTGGGDCDDHNILTGTLLALNGITPRMRVTAQKYEAEGSHIYPIAGLPKTAPTKWIALDTTLPGRRFNVEAPYAKLWDYDA